MLVQCDKLGLGARKVLLLVLLPQCFALEFLVNASSWSAHLPHFFKRVGVYQTPLTNASLLAASVPFLSLAAIRDLRYEMGVGKPGAFAFDQVYQGSDGLVAVNFTALDPFVIAVLQDAGGLLLPLTYTPLPLQPCSGWQCWKDVPSNLTAWTAVSQAYAAHYAAIAAAGAAPAPTYEVWNEPDLPGDGGKVFFNGDVGQYAAVYAAALAMAQHSVGSSADTSIGGPAIAYNVSYLQPVVQAIASNFASIHAYANYGAQLSALQAELINRPDLPMRLTEYNSFSTFAPGGINNRYSAAALFFRDVIGMMAQFPDLSNVYWAQWIDDTATMSLGMLTPTANTSSSVTPSAPEVQNSGVASTGSIVMHKKALYNALLLYARWLPVDRVDVTPQSAVGYTVYAALGATEDDSIALGVVAWNGGCDPDTVNITVLALPAALAVGTATLYRIDASHGSYVDDPSSEDLVPAETWNYTGNVVTWSGTIPELGTAFIRVVAAPPSKPKVDPSLTLADADTQDAATENVGLTTSPSVRLPMAGAGNRTKGNAGNMGRYIRDFHYFADRNASGVPLSGWADYQYSHTTARLGQGMTDDGIQQIGALYAISITSAAHTVAASESTVGTAHKLVLQARVQCAGPFLVMNENSLLAIRVDYEAAPPSGNVSFASAAMWHDGTLSANRTSTLPWGTHSTGPVPATNAVSEPNFCGQEGFTVDVGSCAPPTWTGRFIASFVLQNRGAGSRVVIQLSVM